MHVSLNHCYNHLEFFIQNKMFVNFCDHTWMCGTYLMNCFNDIAFDTRKKKEEVILVILKNSFEI